MREILPVVLYDCCQLDIDWILDGVRISEDEPGVRCKLSGFAVTVSVIVRLVEVPVVELLVEDEAPTVVLEANPTSFSDPSSFTLILDTDSQSVVRMISL